MSFVDERGLRNVAAIVSVAGIAALFLVSLYYSPVERPVYLIDRSLYGEYVETSGIVSAVVPAGDYKIMEIWNLSSIAVPLFFDANPSVGDFARVRGVVRDYKGSVELVPSGPRDFEIIPARPRFAYVSSLSDRSLYEPVLVRGVVSGVSPKGDFLVATVNDSTGSIRVFLSEKSVSKGDFVEISGIVKRYYSSLELVPREVVRLSGP